MVIRSLIYTINYSAIGIVSRIDGSSYPLMDWAVCTILCSALWLRASQFAILESVGKERVFSVMTAEARRLKRP